MHVLADVSALGLSGEGAEVGLGGRGGVFFSRLVWGVGRGGDEKRRG